LKIFIPATSANLGPGFDALGLALDLHNEVTITPSSVPSISIKGEGSTRPRLKSHNPFVSIFHETYLRLMGKKDIFRFEFFNRIPLSRGLGSSSAVIVGAIASAHKMAGVKAERGRVLDMALAYESHPDNIAPAVHGGFTVSVVEGLHVYTQKKVLPKEICAVLVIPDRPMSTAKSRTQLPKHYSMKEAVFNLSHAAALSGAFFNESWELLAVASKDTMHEERRMQQLPELFKVRELALANGALMSTLSGSGSTFFNVAYTNEAKSLAKSLQNAFPDFRVVQCAFDNEGFYMQDS
jgi:homoserine kinase